MNPVIDKPVLVEGRNVAEILDRIHSEPIDYYPEDTVPSFIESPLDSVKYDNSDMSLDDAVAINGGRFFMCNTGILADKW